MHLEEARTLKREMFAYVEQLLGGRVRGAAAAAAGVAPQTAQQVGIALGVAPRGADQFDLAVRYRLGTPTARMVVRRVCDQASEHVDVRRTGRIRPLAARVRPPLPRSQAAGLTDRIRPLRPGVSIAHYRVTAGTLGGFVLPTVSSGDQGQAAEAAPAVHVLSNWHVLAGSPDAQPGDPIVQPGPVDGGTLPGDRVGELALSVPLRSEAANTVDAALALLDEPQVDPSYPVGRLAGVGEVTGDETVAKLGRTTGLTEGRVSAFELDDVLVEYGEPLGQLRFDDQIEVEPTGPAPFSRGGDSGSLVYRPADDAAIGLLFAGSESGGPDGQGLTYVNPLTAVLSALGASLYQSR
jgi:hypothetical protein